MSIRSFLTARGVDYDSLSNATKFYIFIGRLRDMGVITNYHYHEYFGIRNNIPRCCIKFFIENFGYNVFEQSVKMGMPRNSEYAMCPECIKEYQNGIGHNAIS